MSASGLFLVNLGCGSRFRPGWRNFDLRPTSPQVEAADFVAGIPLRDASASCVYHSHVLEHLPLAVAKRFLKECYRVVAPGGTLRCVVPDLERSARDYLAVLDARRRGENREADHRWMLIELLDQLVRTRPGGEMGQMLAEKAGNDAFVLPRLGAYGRTLTAGWRRPQRQGRLARIMSMLEKRVPGPWGRVLSEALYRSLGDVHCWMYDELSLADMLREAGFEAIQRRDHLQSGIPGWDRVGLDADEDGTPYKGVSLYMEACRPAAT